MWNYLSVKVHWICGFGGLKLGHLDSCDACCIFSLKSSGISLLKSHFYPPNPQKVFNESTNWPNKPNYGGTHKFFSRFSFFYFHIRQICVVPYKADRAADLHRENMKKKRRELEQASLDTSDLLDNDNGATFAMVMCQITWVRVNVRGVKQQYPHPGTKKI